MSNEPFTREPGWEYISNQSANPQASTEGWHAYMGGWVPAGNHQFQAFCPDRWFRRQLPAAPLADGWVKFSEREFTKEDLPVWAYYPTRESKIRLLDFMGNEMTHWMACCTLPAPPQAPSQQEIDEQAFEAAANHDLNDKLVRTEYYLGWKAGLRHGRDGK